MPKTYTVKEVADILGFSTNSIYTFLKEKRIKGVRIGKGRFRIPEEEMARILHLSKKASPAVAPTVQVVQSGISVPAASPFVPLLEGDAVFIRESGASLTKNGPELRMPNIFDWFVGLGAIVAGVGLYILNTTQSAADLPRMPLIYPIIRVVLISTGLGLLASSIFTKTRGWPRVFHFLLSVMGFVNAYGLLKAGDIEGAFLYGALALVIGVTNVVRFGGIAAIGMYATLIAVLIPATMLFFPQDAHVQVLAQMLNLDTFIMGIASMIVAALAIAAFWVGYAGNRPLFVMATWFLAICDILVAIWYASLQYWSRSFFIVVLGYFTGLLPYWWPLQQKISRRYAAMLHGVFIGIGCVLLLAVLIVYLLQQSIWTSREREVMNKVHLGHARLLTALESVQSALTVAASNAEFVEVVADKDLDNLNKFSKIIYESNPNIRRLIFLDKDGMGISLYPYGTFDEPNFAFRDYFQQTKNTGKAYISDVFQARSDQAGRYVVVVAVPLYDQKAVFSGVMTASIDLDRLGLQLAQIASASQGENFVIVDARGLILSHPNKALIGTTAPATDPLFLALRGEEGILQGTMIENMYGMMAYAYIPELRWAISLRIPSIQVFGLASTSIWIVFGVVSAILIASIVLFSYIHNRMASQTEGGT